jgi:hypothetical protein
MFRFIIEYSSVKDFGPWVIGLFLCEDFWKTIFWLVLKLEIRCRILISSRILVSFRGIPNDFIFAWLNICVSIIVLFDDTF